MKCPLCNEKKFSMVYESHKPIEDCPVAICWGCLCSILAEKGGLYSSLVRKRVTDAHQALNPQRCS